MNEAILTLNAGSSSIKFALFRSQQPLSQVPEMVGQMDGIGAHGHFVARDQAGNVIEECPVDLPATGRHAAAVHFLVEWLHAHEGNWRVIAVGHRVVHGSTHYTEPVVVSPRVLQELSTYIPLAPVHQPHNIAGIEAMMVALPQVPQVACFDTAFHRTQPEVAQLYALPRQWFDQGVRRYGFHGLSYEYIAESLPGYLGGLAQGKVVVAHLGNGASLCALSGLKSVATSMGFSTLEGLVMGTRPGNLDPGILLYLMQHHHLDAKALEQMLYQESGLLGVSGISQDMRELMNSAEPNAVQAVELFCYRLVQEIGAMAAALGGMDALVFTGGIGENSSEIRHRVCAALSWLGVGLDESLNQLSQVGILSSETSAVQVLMIQTNEEWMIARHTAGLVA
jgi:acetate kinase